MPYCATSDVRSLRLPASDTSAVNEAKLREHVKAADAEIDSRLGLRFVVPFSPVPEQIRQISLTLAAAYALKPTFSGGGENKEPTLADVYRKEALDQLELLASGALALPGATLAGDTVTGAPSSVGVHSNYGYRAPHESLCTLSDHAEMRRLRGC